MGTKVNGGNSSRGNSNSNGSNGSSGGRGGGGGGGRIPTIRTPGAKKTTTTQQQQQQRSGVMDKCFGALLASLNKRHIRRFKYQTRARACLCMYVCVCVRGFAERMYTVVLICRCVHA
jgi:hypothetical protein